jgi:hypothetical protein
LSGSDDPKLLPISRQTIAPLSAKTMGDLPLTCVGNPPSGRTLGGGDEAQPSRNDAIDRPQMTRTNANFRMKIGELAKANNECS